MPLTCTFFDEIAGLRQERQPRCTLRQESRDLFSVEFFFYFFLNEYVIIWNVDDFNVCLTHKNWHIQNISFWCKNWSLRNCGLEIVNHTTVWYREYYVAPPRDAACVAGQSPIVVCLMYYLCFRQASYRQGWQIDRRFHLYSSSRVQLIVLWINKTHSDGGSSMRCVEANYGGGPQERVWRRGWQFVERNLHTVDASCQASLLQNQVLRRHQCFS